MVGRELAGSHRVRFPMPAWTAPAVTCDMRLDGPLRQPPLGAGASDRVVERAPEAVREAPTAAAVATPLVGRGPAAGADMVLAATAGADA